MSRILRNPDVVSGLILLVFGGISTWLALDISSGPAALTLPPNFVPLLCAIGILVCGAIVLARGFFQPRRAQPTVLDLPIAGLALALGLYYWFFDAIDFRLGTFAFVLVVMVIMGCRNWKELLIVPIVTSAGIWLVFRYLFEILLPTWN